MEEQALGKMVRELLILEGFGSARDRSHEPDDLEVTRKDLVELLKDVGKSGDVDMILVVEWAVLQDDLERYANNGAMVTSVGTALQGLDAARSLAWTVRDQAAYRAIDQRHALPKDRSNGVPHDEARQFFRSHDARLVNMDRSRLDDQGKAIVDERKRNIRIAEKAYIDLQRKNLGLAPASAPERGHGLSR